VPRFLLDTDHITLLSHHHQPLLKQLGRVPAGDVATSAVTVEEVLRGRLAALAKARTGPARIGHYAYLLVSLQLFAQLVLVTYDQAAENEFQRLFALRLRIGTQDLKIAAVALAHNLTLLTRNRRHFGLVSGLRLDDWSV
jgi:tRNA(fMet)-specific endonuclease VapC